MNTPSKGKASASEVRLVNRLGDQPARAKLCKHRPSRSSKRLDLKNSVSAACGRSTTTSNCQLYTPSCEERSSARI